MYNILYAPINFNRVLTSFKTCRLKSKYIKNTHDSIAEAYGNHRVRFTRNVSRIKTSVDLNIWRLSPRRVLLHMHHLYK